MNTIKQTQYSINLCNPTRGKNITCEICGKKGEMYIQSKYELIEMNDEEGDFWRQTSQIGHYSCLISNR